MTLTVLGINHRTAPVEVRERLAWADGDVPDVAARLAGLADTGAVVLSTCNRTEVYLASARQEAVTAVWRMASERLGKPAEPFGYLHHGRAVARHLFRVAAGLDSLVLGEAQIQGQVRRAWELSRAHAGPLLDRLFHTALSVGGEVRARTQLGVGAASVPSASVELARKIFGPLAGRDALVLGSGEMAELAVGCLAAEGVRTAVVAHKNRERAEGIARRLGARAIGFEGAWERFRDVDIVICSTAAPHAVVTPAAVGPAVAQRAGRPLCILDIAVPRDVQPDVGRLEHVFLYDIDDLEGVVAATLGHRRREIPEAERIVERELAFFWSWVQARGVAGTVRALRRRTEAIRRDEVARALDALGHLRPQDRERVEHLARALTNKLLHDVMVRLRAIAGNGREGQIVDALHYLFDLGAAEAPDTERDDSGEEP